MPAVKHQIAFDPQFPVETSPTAASAPMVGDIVALGDSIGFSESPARLLHERLSDHFEGSPDDLVDERWSGAARVAFIVGVSLGLWGVIGGAVAVLIA